MKCHHVNGGLTESLGKEASADEPAYRLAGNVSVEFDVALVEEQVRACGLRSGYAREPLAVSLVLREEAILSEGGSALLCESKRKPLVANGRLSVTQAARCPQGTRVTPDEAVIGPWGKRLLGARETSGRKWPSHRTDTWRARQAKRLWP